MKKIEIEIPDGHKAEWVNGVLTLVEDKPIEYKFKVGDKVKSSPDPEIIYTVEKQFQENGRPMYELSDGWSNISRAEKWLKLAPQPITERIKTFEDAYQWCETHNSESDILEDFNNIVGDVAVSDDLFAYLKLRIITAALNEGWEPTKPNDGVWVAYNPEEDAFYAKRSPAVPVSPKLWFKTAKLAIYAAEQFSDLYADFCGCKKGGEE